MMYNWRMSITKNKIEKRIKDTQAEIQELEAQLAEKRAFLSGLQEAAKLFPKEVSNGTQQSEKSLRLGSDLDKTRLFLKKKGAPVHIVEILEGIGKEATQEARLSLSGSLGAYFRRGEIFTRPRPNTFGLVEFGENQSSQVEEQDDDDDDDDDVPF